MGNKGSTSRKERTKSMSLFSPFTSSADPKNKTSSASSASLASVQANRLGLNLLEFGDYIKGEWKTLFNNPLYSDISLKVGTETFYAHRVILAMWSPEWSELIMSVNEIEIPTDNDFQQPHLYKAMLRYMYTTQCKVAEEDIMLLLQLAHKYGVDPLKETCGELFWERSKENRNVKKFLEIVTKYGLSRLETRCAQYLASEFHEIIKQDPLIELPVSTWQKLLSSDDIKVNSEMDLFNTVMKISRQQTSEKERLKVLNELLPCVRFPFIPMQALVSEVEKLEEKVPILHELLFNAYKFKALPKTKDNKKKKTEDLGPQYRPRRGIMLQWSTTNASPGIKVDEEQHSVSHTGTSSTWQSVCGSEYFSTGYHVWHLRVDSNLSNWLFIGVATKQWRGWTDQSNGYVGHYADSWSCGSYRGWGKAHNSSNQNYGNPYVTGDVVSIMLDCDQKTISFSLNGQDQGQAFTNVDGEVCLAVTLYNSGDKLTLVTDYDVSSNKK